MDTFRGNISLAPNPPQMKVPAFHLFGSGALIQLPSSRLIVDSDLVIVVQANNYLINYPLQLLNATGWKRVAFWGHGFNHQGDATSYREKLKQFLATRIHWWFTYTRRTAEYLGNLGFSIRRITVLNNAIDTGALSIAVAKHRAEGVGRLKQSIVGSSNAFVALYCGSLYEDKQIGFLIEVGDLLFASHQNFRLVIIGDGPERDFVVQASSARPWLKYLGAQFGDDKDKAFAASDIFLNPGLVGLAILDSFAAGLPFITSTYPRHSPEIAYLDPGKNGLLLAFEKAEFVEGVAKVIKDSNLRARLSSGASASARAFSLENMVASAAEGINAALEDSSRRSERS